MSRPVGERAIGWFLDNPLITLLFAFAILFGGLYVSPFDLSGGVLPRNPVAVDAIPDMGENQQIVLAEWPGRSPRDVEDQVAYPLTVALSGLKGVRTVRSTSMFGVATIYIIFDDSVEFYDSRTRILEKLASLPPGTLPDEVVPTLGPDATGLGQIFAYTLEGRDRDGAVVGGWDLDELRSVQDFVVGPALQAASGVAEVSSVGGFERELQVDVDPDALRAHGASLAEVAAAVRSSNLDIGARTLEINGVEYLVRSRGFVENLKDVERAVVRLVDDTPLLVKDVARVGWGPALRRGVLDDAGAPAVGGIVVARYLENPPAVIAAVQEAIDRLADGLPERTLEDGTKSKITVVPYYDRTGLIDETLGTLSSALLQQLLVTLVVVLFMLRSTRSGFLVGAMLPLGVLGTFIGMRILGVQANLMALAGIAIAIGTMVDIGVLFVEAIDRELQDGMDKSARSAAVRKAAGQLAPAVWTSVLTTVVSFLPVFGLVAGDLRLFGPLAATKTLAMLAAMVLGIVVLPGAALWILGRRAPIEQLTRWAWPVLALLAALGLALLWRPLGYELNAAWSVLFVGVILVGVLGFFRLFELFYPTILRWALDHKLTFAALPLGVLLLGGWAASSMQTEHLPAFDEGAFLYMPTTTPHASMSEALRLLSETDAAIAAIPEVDRVVGKAGRAESALDPAPISMIETVVTLHPEYGRDADGRRIRVWRDHIRTTRDIWDEILLAADRPGLTSAPWLMPIGARLVMLQSGMRSPYGLKVQGTRLEDIEDFASQAEMVLRGVPGVLTGSVYADRVVGKPYLEIHLDRDAIGRYGLSILSVQEALEVALGGRTLTRFIQGRERYPIRVRVMREERDSVEALSSLPVQAGEGRTIPLGQLAEVRYARGPQMIRSEDSFPTSYVLFDAEDGVTASTLVRRASQAMREHLASGALKLPEGVTWRFAGTYENQVRTQERLMLILPLVLGAVLVLLHLQFRSLPTTIIIGSGVLVASAGGMIGLWLYGQPWFLNFPLGDGNLREIFQVGPVHLSLAVWVGFIALLGLATDDGVVISTFMKQRLEEAPAATIAQIRERTLEAGTMRIRACLMTTSTTLLALLPVLSSTGKGGDLMMPMALPAVGGMAIAVLTIFVVPVAGCAVEEWRAQWASGSSDPGRVPEA
ncbi:MAG: efflux RND transporter permease subunit [Deltaproteobacteria bacterium]|nr:MAG: efflux RND transporter permease subunit [Deltaproteobacteria bacterium]